MEALEVIIVVFCPYTLRKYPQCVEPLPLMLTEAIAAQYVPLRLNRIPYSSLAVIPCVVTQQPF